MNAEKKKKESEEEEEKVQGKGEEKVRVKETLSPIRTKISRNTKASACLVRIFLTDDDFVGYYVNSLYT